LLPQQLKEALLNLPMVTLSRIQVFSIMAEAQQGEDGKVKYQQFAKTAAAFINRLFDPQLVARRSDMLFRSALTPVELLNGVDKSELQVLDFIFFFAFVCSHLKCCSRMRCAKCLRSSTPRPAAI
jgi:hypothetical protein